jgi:EAL domain-containing protein (putative c-di-GMP-specific phosphodiesterase class I)
LTKYLPVILFAICTLIAVLLAWAVPALWPAALAIAIAGAALAMSMRAQNGSEISYLISDISLLQAENDELRTEIARSHSMIDELADVVEQIASFTAEPSPGVAPEEIESLRAEVTDMRAKAALVAEDDTILTRLGAVEAKVESWNAETDAALTLEEVAPTAPSAENAATAARSVDTGALRSLIARASEKKERVDPSISSSVAPETPVAAVSFSASLTPVFEPTLGAPVAFVLAPNEEEALETAPSLLRHATKIAGELEDAGKEILLFVEFSPSTLADAGVRNSILAAIETSPALQRRLTLLSEQDGLDSGALQTLSLVAEQGCRFALENVRDWSLDLGELAKVGLGYIAVDGIAMANSAQEQGGDPKRLAQALRNHGISLIAGGIFIRDDIETVRALEPVLVMGDGLGIPRVLEPLV